MTEAPAAPAPASDEQWMRLALEEARAAGAAGEVPVGAVVVHQGRLIATGRNSPISAHDPTAHAEVNALRSAAAALGNYRLDQCELFVTLEPCVMCSGAVLHARLSRVVFGAADPRTGAAGSVLDIYGQAALNHHTRVQGGVMAAACARVLQDFFLERRTRSRANAQPLRTDALRTPEARFAGLEPPASFCEMYRIDDLPGLGGLRMVWLDNDALRRRPTGMPTADDVPPIVCLHGPGQWGHMFRHLWPLCGPRRLLVPDLVGHGRSDKPKRADWHRPGQHAQVLAQWLQRLALPPATWAYHPCMQAVMDALVAEGQVGLAGLLPMSPRLMTHTASPDWLLAPFPDRGHMAALHAWKLRDLPQEDLTAVGAAQLFSALSWPPRDRSLRSEGACGA